MDREYHIFEKSRDGSVVWREAVTGRQDALRRLSELANESEKEQFAKHLPSGEVIHPGNSSDPVSST